MDSYFLLAQFVVSVFMAGTIWIIQIVHYPSFLYIEEKNFIDFSHFHSFNISKIVMPIMLIEFGSGLYLLIKSDFNFFFSINFLLILGLWASTFFLSVPLHKKLSTGKSEEEIKKLIYSNWPRTIMWTVKSILLLLYFKKYVYEV